MRSIALVFVLLLAPAGETVRQQATTATRTQGIFGMVTSPLAPVEVPAQIKSLLPQNSVVYVFAHTNMRSGGEEVLVYYPTTRDADGSQTSSPEVAVVRLGKLEKRFEYQNDANWHDVITAYAIFALDAKRQAFGLCVTNTGDGHYSDFLVLTWTPSGYESVFTGFGEEQARLRVRTGKDTEMELWSPAGYPAGTSEQEQCV